MKKKCSFLKVSPQVFQIKIFGTYLGQQEHSYSPTLINTGEGLVLIDSGPPVMRAFIDTNYEIFIDESYECIVKNLNNFGYKLEDISAVLLTHFHFDHSGNARKIKEESGCIIAAHKNEIKYLKRKDELPLPVSYDLAKKSYYKMTEKMYISLSEYISAVHRNLLPLPVDQELSDGDTIHGIVAIYTPGHTPGHTSYAFNDMIVIGDLAYNENHIKSYNLAYTFDPELAEKSLRKVALLGFNTIIPYHGNPFSGIKLKKLVANI